MLGKASRLRDGNGRFRSNSMGFSKKATVSNASFYRAAFTSTSAIFIVLFVLVTLGSLYRGLHEFQMTSAKEMSLRELTFFCILLPIVIIYYAKLTL